VSTLVAYQLQQRNLTNRLATLLAGHPKVNPHYLELEILESGVLSDMHQVFDAMIACHDLGLIIAITDNRPLLGVLAAC
jgi:EAL domain-containing protein (putative c-di-GMP-specific phosphodiesterase class I)